MVSPEDIVVHLEEEVPWLRAAGYEELLMHGERAEASPGEYLRALLLDEAQSMLKIIPPEAHDVQYIADLVCENIRDHLNIDGDGVPGWILRRRNEAAGDRSAEASQ